MCRCVLNTRLDIEYIRVISLFVSAIYDSADSNVIHTICAVWLNQIALIGDSLVSNYLSEPLSRVGIFREAYRKLVRET